MTMDAGFHPRDGAALVSFRGRLWLLGGWNNLRRDLYPRASNNEVWSSSDGITWRQELANAPWAIRHTFGCVVFEDKIWIIGGDSLNGYIDTDVWNSPDGIHWMKLTDDTPWSPRAVHHVLVFDNKIWLLGGQTIPQFLEGCPPARFYNDVWNTTDGIHWKLVTAHAPWSARGMIGNSAVLDGRIWLLGGGTYETPEAPYRHFFTDIWSSTDGAEWKLETENAGFPARQYHDVAAFGGCLWVLEGYGVDNRESTTLDFGAAARPVSKNRNDVWYSRDGVKWTELRGTPWKPRHASSVCVHNGALWLIAGNNMESDVWRLREEAL